MNGSSSAAGSLSSKALTADFISTTEPGRALGAAMLGAWKWLARHSRGVLTGGVSRRLKVAETVSLGDKRFVSILQVDGEQFLIGGSSSNIVLLAKLEATAETLAAGSFESVFSQVESGVGRRDTGSEGLAEVTR